MGFLVITGHVKGDTRSLDDGSYFESSQQTKTADLAVI